MTSRGSFPENVAIPDLKILNGTPSCSSNEASYELSATYESYKSSPNTVETEKPCQNICDRLNAVSQRSEHHKLPGCASNSESLHSSSIQTSDESCESCNDIVSGHSERGQVRTFPDGAYYSRRKGNSKTGGNFEMGQQICGMQSKSWSFETGLREQRTVPADMFQRISKENIKLKEYKELMDRNYQKLKEENTIVQRQLQFARSMLILDENGSPMEGKQVIILQEENSRLHNKVAILERDLEEFQGQMPLNRIQHIDSSPDSSVLTQPNVDRLLHEIETLKDSNKKLDKEKKEFQRDYQRMCGVLDEIIDSSPDELQKRLKQVGDQNLELVDECNMLKIQVDTFAEDYRTEKEQQKKKEGLWDNRFTKLRAENERLTKEVKRKDMEIMRLQAQCHKEFESKMKIQEDFEKRGHVPPQPAAPMPYASSQRLGLGDPSSMTSGVSFEINTCDNCSATFTSMMQLQSHRKTCCEQNRKPGGYL